MTVARPNEDVAAHLDTGHIMRQDEVEAIARTVQGLASLFASIDVNFDECNIEWEPETEEERGLPKVNSVTKKTERMDMWAPQPVAYDLIARAMASADHAQDQEIRLAFLRRGRREYHAGNYIQAFYNYFFFLETQFAGGYSSSRIVKKALIEAQPLRDALTRLRRGRGDAKIAGECAKLFAMNDDDLINHLVDTRGNLHHHAQRRKNIWHPDKPESVIAEADALELIVHEIAMTAALGTMYTDDKNKRLYDSARADHATTNVKIMGYGIKRDGSRVDLPTILVTLAGRIIDRLKLQNLHHQFRAASHLSTNEVEIAEYSICSEDGKQIFARWRREG